MKFLLIPVLLISTFYCNAQIIYSEDIMPSAVDTVEILSNNGYTGWNEYDPYDTLNFDSGRDVFWDLSEMHEELWFRFPRDSYRLAFKHDIPITEQSGVNLRVCHHSPGQYFDEIFRVEYWNANEVFWEYQSEYSRGWGSGDFDCEKLNWEHSRNYAPHVLRMQFPLRLGDYWDQSFAYQNIGRGSNPYRSTATLEGRVNVIGIGNLVTPRGSLTKCMLIEERYYRNTDAGKYRIKRWTWVKQGVPWPVMEIFEAFQDSTWRWNNEADIYLEAKYQINISSKLLPTQELSRHVNRSTVRYDSESETIIFDKPLAGEIKIYSLDGSLVLRKVVNRHAEIRVEGLMRGIYIVAIKDRNGYEQRAKILK